MPRGDVRIPLALPMRGFRNDLPKHEVPDGYLSGAQNVLVRNGQVLVRPGQVRLTSTGPSTNSVMVGIYYLDHLQAERVIVGTTIAFWLYQGGSWSDITGATVLTGGLYQQVRLAAFPLSNVTRVIAVNDKDAVQVTTGTGTFSNRVIAAIPL